MIAGLYNYDGDDPIMSDLSLRLDGVVSQSFQPLFIWDVKVLYVWVDGWAFLCAGNGDNRTWTHDYKYEIEYGIH